MLFYLHFAAVIGFGIYYYIKDKREKKGMGEYYAIGVFMCGLFSFLFLGIMCCGINDKYGEVLFSLKDTKAIVSLSNGTEAQGSFTLGCGSIEEVPYYYFFKEVAKDTYKIDKVNANETVIKETTNRVPCLAWNEVTKKSVLAFRTGFELFDVNTLKEGNNILYVPKGTVVKEFAVK